MRPRENRHPSSQIPIAVAHTAEPSTFECPPLSYATATNDDMNVKGRSVEQHTELYGGVKSLRYLMHQFIYWYP